MNAISNRHRLVRGLWTLAKVAIVVSIIAGLVYWQRFAPVQVSESPVKRGLVVAEVMGTGTLEARVAATVGAKISGRIEQVLVDQGDQVKVGDTLVKLDDEELQQQVAIAKANVAAAKAGIDRLIADQQRADAALTQAKKNDDRVQSLTTRGAASQEESDKSTEALAVAITGVSRAEAAITEGEKQRISAEQTLAYHLARLADATVVAPFDGLIIRRDREPGDIVMPGSSIMKLISMKQIWIRAWVDETEIARLHPGQTARIVFRSEATKNYEGKVVRLGQETDRETREFIVDVDALSLPENWAVGQRAEAFIEVDRKEDAPWIAAKHVIQRAGELGVFLKQNESAVWTPIELGLRNRDIVEVTSGLNENDVIVTPMEPNATLTDGRKVTSL